MPYAFAIHHVRLPRNKDCRVKITEEHKREIKELHKAGMSIRGIARRFQKICSRRSIQLILFPERLAIAKAQYKERRKDGRYYIKEKHTKAMRKHRRYKQKVLN